MHFEAKTLLKKKANQVLQIILKNTKCIRNIKSPFDDK